jgi:hypothetical protein
MHEENFVDFINEILVGGLFDWFVTLVFLSSRVRPPSASRKLWEEVWEGDPEGQGRWTKTPETPGDCLRQWLDEVQFQGPGGAHVTGYLVLEELRSEEEVRYHVLLANWNGFEDAWMRRWKEISGGWAFERQLDDRIGRFIGHMVMRAGCSLTVKRGRLSRHYTQEDFRPWKVKSY